MPPGSADPARRVIGGEPVKRHRPGRGDRLRVHTAPVLVQSVIGSLGKQPQVLSAAIPVSASSDPACSIASGRSPSASAT